MRHYFTNDGAEKRVYERTARYEDKEFRFNTSDGVFSKRAVDDGTDYLIKTVLPLIENKAAGVIDLGCGYGVIGIVLAALRPRLECRMLDINEQAVRLANQNAALNGVANRAEAEVRDGLSGLRVPADYVLTNPPFRAGKQVVLRFITESFAALNSGGVFYAVLRKQQGAESYIKAICEVFGNVQVLLKKKGYVVISAKK